ncbi:hypothetical protein Tco_0996580 [Tanacetum coccineum]
MGDENPIRTLGDYSRPSHEGYRNTIELPKGNNVVPLRSDTKTDAHSTDYGPRIQINTSRTSLKLLVPQSSNTKFVCFKEDDGEVMFIKIIQDDDEPQNEDPNEGEGATAEETVVEYFNTFPTRNELTYHRTDEVSYKMPHKIEQYDSRSDLENEHTKSVYLRSEEDKRRGVENVMSKILAFYKECLELGPEYLT